MRKIGPTCHKKQAAGREKRYLQAPDTRLSREECQLVATRVRSTKTHLSMQSPVQALCRGIQCTENIPKDPENAPVHHFA